MFFAAEGQRSVVSSRNLLSPSLSSEGVGNLPPESNHSRATTGKTPLTQKLRNVVIFIAETEYQLLDI